METIEVTIEGNLYYFPFKRNLALGRTLVKVAPEVNRIINQHRLYSSWSQFRRLTAITWEQADYVKEHYLRENSTLTDKFGQKLLFSV